HWCASRRAAGRALRSCHWCHAEIASSAATETTIGRRNRGGTRCLRRRPIRLPEEQGDQMVEILKIEGLRGVGRRAVSQHRGGNRVVGVPCEHDDRNGGISAADDLE